MVPAMAFLLLFLAYPLVLGSILCFTDVRIGRPGIFIDLENYIWMWDDPVFWLSVFNTMLYTVVAIVTSFTDCDACRWGSIMAGALFGSLPLVILYAFLSNTMYPL